MLPEQPAPISASPSNVVPAIEADGLTKVFRARWKKTEVRAVDGVSIRVLPGSTYGLLGPNGAGKTTFIKMLLSAVHPTSGRASLFGLDRLHPDSQAGVVRRLLEARGEAGRIHRRGTVGQAAATAQPAHDSQPISDVGSSGFSRAGSPGFSRSETSTA